MPRGTEPSPAWESIQETWLLPNSLLRFVNLYLISHIGFSTERNCRLLSMINTKEAIPALNEAFSFIWNWCLPDPRRQQSQPIKPEVPGGVGPSPCGNPVAHLSPGTSVPHHRLPSCETELLTGFSIFMKDPGDCTKEKHLEDERGKF